MKLYDFDGMFDEKLAEYISKNPKRYREEEWEDVIPALYDKFGDSKIKSLGVTPREFYAAMTDGELLGCLRTHLSRKVPVSEFLCREIEKRHMEDMLMPLLDGTREEREYAMNIIGGADKAIPKYMEILVSCDDADIKDRCAELIKEKADLVTASALENYAEGRDREYMLEILSRTVVKDDRIFVILIREFRSDADNVPMHASYLASYGDERALPYLYEKIEEEGISFIEFKELKLAIESLGGEYEKERDFSCDPYYDLLKRASAPVGDIFGAFGKKD